MKSVSLKRLEMSSTKPLGTTTAFAPAWAMSKAEIEAAVNRIVFWPHAWSRASKEARLCAAHRFPYGVVYVVEADRIVIVAVMHLHRRRGYWRNRVKDLGP